MSEPTLDPCPFCGSKCFFNHEDVTNSRGEEYTRAWVECTGCDMRSIAKRVVYGVPAAKVMLSGLWNKRAPATPPADAALADSIDSLGFVISGDNPPVKEWVSECGGGCMPATKEEKMMWDVLQSALRVREVPVAEIASSIIRDLCESEPEDPDHPDSICVHVDFLRTVIDREIDAMLVASKEDGK